MIGDEERVAAGVIGVRHVFGGVAVLLAAVWSYCAATLGDAAGWEPLIAAFCAVIPVAVFAWARRRCDALEFVLPAIAVAYAAYLGIAIARVPSLWLMTAWTRGSLSDKWPAVLMAGVPFALILTVAVAMPIYVLPKRKAIDPHADEALWTFVREYDVVREKGTSVEDRSTGSG